MRDWLRALFEELRRDIQGDPTLGLIFVTPILFIPTIALLILASFI